MRRKWLGYDMSYNIYVHYSSNSESELSKWYGKECQSISPEQMRIGDFVICWYDGELFLGAAIATLPDGNKTLVKAIQKCIGR